MWWAKASGSDRVCWALVECAGPCHCCSQPQGNYAHTHAAAHAHHAITHTPLQPAEEQRLYRGDALLEDGQSLAELGVQNDDELGVAYRLPDGGCTHVLHAAVLVPLVLLGSAANHAPHAAALVQLGGCWGVLQTMPTAAHK